MNSFKKVMVGSLLVFSSESYKPDNNKDLYCTLHYNPQQEYTVKDIIQEDRIQKLSDTLTYTPSIEEKKRIPIDTIPQVQALQITDNDSIIQKQKVSENNQKIYHSTHLSIYQEDTTTSTKKMPLGKSEHKQALYSKTNDINNTTIYFQSVLDSIVVPGSIKFDTEYVQKNISTILESCFDVQDGKLIFKKPCPQEESKIYTTMDNLKIHIKSQNGPLVKLFLGKKTLRNFIKDEFENIHRLLIEHNNLSYLGGKDQFYKDFNSIIDIYQ